MNKEFNSSTSNSNLLETYSNSFFNVCSSRPVNILKILNIINTYFKKPKIIKVSFQKADVLNTHGSKKKLIKFLKLKKFTTIEQGVPLLCEWAKNFSKFL